MPPKLTYNIIFWCNNGDRKARTTFSCPTPWTKYKRDGQPEEVFWMTIPQSRWNRVIRHTEWRKADNLQHTHGLLR